MKKAADIYHAAELPWLAPARAQLQRILASGRLPHALLIQAAPGLGAEVLAHWVSSLLLCGSAVDVSGANAPCGACKACRLIAAGTHPDLTWVTRAEDAKQLQVDQIRAVSETLALKSYAGGYKVAVVAEADLMNANAANALLKTLEEPPPATVLVLCSARPTRLPATIVSRCQRLKVATPARSVALQWLNTRQPNEAWPEILAYAAAAPLRALELAAGGFAELDRDMRATLAGLREGTLDVPGTAEHWSKADLKTRLDWFETWITQSLRTAPVPSGHLPTAEQTRNIYSLFQLLDRVRGLKFELDTSLNMQLAAEELLVRTGAALK
jgi:DNA polymerase-3 subunit delta'